MNAERIVRRWEAYVGDHLLPSLHGHQTNCLADLSFGMLLAGSCQAGQIALSVPGRAKPASVKRRWERLLANRRLRPRQVLADLAGAVLRAWPARTLLLVLDETPQANHLRCLKISLGYRKRAMPLVGVCYAPHQPPEPMPRLVWRLLHQVARLVPAGVKVTLLADRGLAWPLVLDICESLGWHYALRVQGSTRVILPDGRQVSAAELAPRPGKRYEGCVAVFKKAGWRRVEISAAWPRGSQGPWLVISDQPAGPRRFATYGKRVWTEQSFRDEKSHGFWWQRSRVRDPVRAMRLILVMAMAMLLAISLGTWVLKTGRRHALETGRRRKLSVFQLGLRWLRHAILHGLEPRVRMYLHPA